VASERGKDEAAKLLDLAFDAIFSIEQSTHRVTYWNAGAERMYGYSALDAVGQVPHELLQTRYTGSADTVYEIAAKEAGWEGRMLRRRKDGSEIVVEARLVLDREAALILEVNREVSEHFGAAERFRVLVESVKDYAIFLLDTRGRISSWNEGARRIKGYEAHEIIGTHFSAFYPQEDVDNGKPERELRMAREAGRVEDEGWRVRKDGTLFFASVVITALHDPSGKLTGYAKVTRDITASRLERQRLLDLERSKSAFLNLVAHELRSPLTVLRGYLSLFRDAAPEQRRDLEDRALPALEAKTIEMSRLVDQMVEVARLEEGSLRLRVEVVDLAGIAEQSIELSRALEERPGRRIVIEPFGRELNVTGDPERIQIIINNLLSNAIKYSPGGGDVEVILDETKEFGRVAVNDHGVGVPLAEQIRLFTRFMRVDRPDSEHVPGTGMGLYLSRELARRMGGDVVLQWSGPGGSSFAVLMPLAPK
jgi:PAS domain S-box-containing protein